MRRRLAYLARRAWIWTLRVAVSFLMLGGFLPTPLLRLWLEWLHESMTPDHPGMETVLRELAEVGDRCRA